MTPFLENCLLNDDGKREEFDNNPGSAEISSGSMQEFSGNNSRGSLWLL